MFAWRLVCEGSSRGWRGDILWCVPKYVRVEVFLGTLFTERYVGAPESKDRGQQKWAVKTGSGLG
jgi:hypothetical protein